MVPACINAGVHTGVSSPKKYSGSERGVPSFFFHVGEFLGCGAWGGEDGSEEEGEEGEEEGGELHCWLVWWFGGLGVGEGRVWGEVGGRVRWSWEERVGWCWVGCGVRCSVVKIWWLM